MTKQLQEKTIYLAVYNLILRDNKVFLLKRQNTNYASGYYTLPSGHVDPGETATDSLIRETKEEAGIDIKTENISLVHTMHVKGIGKTFISLFYKTSIWESDPFNSEPHKASEVGFFDLDNLPKKIVPEVKVALKNIKDNKAYSELGWLESLESLM